MAPIHSSSTRQCPLMLCGTSTSLSSPPSDLHTPPAAALGLRLSLLLVLLHRHLCMPPAALLSPVLRRSPYTLAALPPPRRRDVCWKTQAAQT